MELARASGSGALADARMNHASAAHSGRRGDTYPLALFAIGYEWRVSLESHLFDVRATLGAPLPSLPASAALADFM
jgi:hypothetical protein